MRVITVKSSIELTIAQKTRLEEGIRAKESEELTFTYVTDDIVSGIMLIDGERIVDASGATGLHKIIKFSDKLLHGEKGKGITSKDIPELLKEKLDELVTHKPDETVCGKVISSADGVVRISGLPNCRYGELIVIGRNGFALAMNLEKDKIGAILLSDSDTVGYGDLAYTTGTIIEVPVGDAMLGRVVNPLGEPLDGGPEIRHEHTRRIECEAPRIIDREPVSEPMSTGLLAIDSMVPIGRGQRELIIGDRQTGKTAIALDTIINQRDKNVYCVYVAIGQRAATVAKLVATLKENNAMSYTTVVVATAADSSPLQYVAPYAGCAIAEHFMYEGKDVLIIYDDLSKHAVAYRTLSLLLRRPAGREAFPGDIFYLHSKLLERSAKLSEKIGGGSITALPIIETQAGDISAYIPTNVISITDGQIYLESELFNAGQRPAINVGLSVSRVGGAAQTKLTKKLSAKLRLNIAHYRELAIFAQFGSSLDNDTKIILEDGAKMVEALKQEECKPLSTLREEIYLYAIVNGFLREIPLKRVREFLSKFYDYAALRLPAVMRDVKEKGDLTEENEKELKAVTAEFVALFTEA